MIKDIIKIEGNLRVQKLVSFDEIYSHYSIIPRKNFWLGILYHTVTDWKIDCLILEDNSVVILEDKFDYLASTFADLFTPDYSDLILQNFSGKTIED